MPHTVHFIIIAHYNHAAISNVDSSYSLDYSLAIYVLFLRKSNKTQIQQFKVGQVTMSSLHDTRSIGVVNPAAIEYPNDDEQSYMDMIEERNVC